MAFTGVPMMIGGGNAQHSADLTRKMIANFFYGSEGVIKAPDLAIRAYEAPTSAVRMMPGGVAILNRSPASDREAYFDHSGVEEMIPIAPTGSSGPRSDLIMARVEDPYSAGTQWQYPSDTKRGPYIFPRVEPQVSRQIYSPHQLGKGWSAVALARVDQPANNTAITQNMITDLRSIANGPQRYQEPDPPAIPEPPKVTQATWTESRIQAYRHELPYTQRSFIAWPGSMAWDVCIPDWACGVDIFSVVQNPKQEAGHVWGEAVVGIDAQGTRPEFYGTPMPFDMDAISTTMPNRIPIFYSTTLKWGNNRDFAGRIRRFAWRAKMYNDANTRGKLVADQTAVCYINLSFKVEPVIN